ncbi:Mur ligase family protein [Daeguia caeni]|uniref:Mur ligase family protein n=1 Tax=Daeguia caeni TaxID=439612 RepID=A0ABV9H408_9HYPH
MDHLSPLFTRLKQAIQPLIRPLPEDFPPCVLFVSFTDRTRRAVTHHVTGDDFETCWNGLQKIVAEDQSFSNPIQDLRVDWVEYVEPMSWAELALRMSRTKRNYFRYGLTLDRSFRHAFLETELNANAMLYGGVKIGQATINEGNFLRYARMRYGLTRLDRPDDGEVIRFSTLAAYTSRDDEEVYHIAGAGREAGRRIIKKLQPDDILQLIRKGSQYLATQVNDEGRFIYGWHPCFDREIPFYNSLRHTSTLYSMIEAWEITQDPALKQAIDRGLHYLTTTLIKPLQVEGGEIAVLVEADGEIKLGGNAVCLLALSKYSAVTGTTAYHPLLEKLALAISAMQDPETGAFSHVYSYPDFKLKQKFRIIYYDGEAAFGMMRLYNLTGDQRWLDLVEKAFGHFIKAEHWKAHDHWLSYAVNELTRYRPKREYYQFGIDNFKDYLDFVANRITTFPTLLELMMAATAMVSRIAADPDYAPLLDQLDLEKFHAAREARAHYLLNGHFWPEFAMFFANPQRMEGSFFIRHHAFRVRIDDVEHYLSGLVAYYKYRKAEAEVELENLSETGAVKSGMPVWDARTLQTVTGGEWQVAPQENWSATGLCIYGKSYQPGNVAVLRHGPNEKGMILYTVTGLTPKPAAIVTSKIDEKIVSLGVPVLKVADTGNAILALGKHARDRFAGPVIGITGSSGKTTTVAMMAHVLKAFGKVESTRNNANLPHGASWNLASFDPAADFFVSEMAIGRMGLTARIVRPTVAVFMNVSAAHLGENTTLRDIARTKAAIFSGMTPGEVAVLNRDMQEWDTVHDAALKAGLKVITYGQSEGVDYQLVAYNETSNLSLIKTPTGQYQIHLKAAGKHMALNALSVIATVESFGLDIEKALAQLASFTPLAGRGEKSRIVFCGQAIDIIDDAYNANPDSMRVALERLDHEKSAKRRIAVLGEMAELGPKAQELHKSLADRINKSSIDRIYVVGALYADFWQALDERKRGHYAENLDALKLQLIANLSTDDAVLFKGSNSTKMHELVDWVKTHDQNEAHQP